MAEMEKSYSQTVENILKAVSEVTSAQVKALSFDKTIKAIIINADQAERGIYEVSQIGAEKTNIFTAHSNNTTYQKSDCVYITVPEGDMTSGNKIIIGKYVDESESYYNYIDPMAGYLDITGNIIDFLSVKQWELTANYTDNEIIIWSVDNLGLRGYDRLALRGEFKTWLQSLDINSGTYGLELRIQDNTGKFITYKLTSREMYGNPYYYETFYSQNILVNISSIEEIQYMELAFMHYNDFYKSNGERAESLDSDGVKIPSNIFLKAPYISVGYDVTQFTGDDVRIFTEDELIFDSRQESQQRTIKANWIHAAEGKSARVIDDIIEMPANPDYDPTTAGTAIFPHPETKVDLMWFQYDTECTGTHFAAGQGWVEDKTALNEFTYNFYTPTGRETDGEANNLPYVKFKAIIMTPSIRYVNAIFYKSKDYTTMLEVKNTELSDIHEECMTIFHEVMNGTKTYNDGKTQITDKYKGKTSDDFSEFITALNAYSKMRSDVKWYDSGELIFPNAGYSPAKYSEGSIANLRISVDPEHLKGTYLLYDDTGYLTDSTAANVERYCEALYDTIAGVVNSETTSMEDIAYEVDTSEVITWYIPLESTMIAPPTHGVEYYDGDTYVASCEIGPHVEPTAEGYDALDNANIPAGKYCKISRVPQYDETTVDDKLLLAEHHMFARQKFKIKDYYTQLETNNTIYCRIVKGGKRWYASGAMEFGVTGTNGTDSTFILKMHEVKQDGTCAETETSALSLTTTYYEIDKDNGAVTLKDPVAGKIVLVPKLYDYNKQEKENYFSSSNITYKFYPNIDLDKYSPFTATKNGDGSLTIGWNQKYDEFATDKDYYLVIEAEVAYKITYNFLKYTDTKDEKDPTFLSEEKKALGKKIGDYVLDENGNKQPDLDENKQPRTRDDYLKTYLPISIVKKKILTSKVATAGTTQNERPEAPKMTDYQKQVVGANKVIYDRNGSNAKYYKDPYKLYDETLTEVAGVTWSAKIKAVDLEMDERKKATVASFYPTITAENILQPLETYILGQDTMPNYSVIGKDSNNKIICVQPVLVIQNKYGSAMLNKWDGSLTIDEKNGTILASMVGAGIKDENNTFSGVLMGEVSQAFNDNHNGLGLYGFHQNDQSFGFNIDGRAFIGKAGHGRLWFDGNNGTITSGTYSDGVSDKYKIVGTNDIRPQQGMEIDLDGSDNISSSVKMFGPTGGFVVDTKGIVTDRYGRSNPEDAANRSLVFKLFTGAYETSERGMIYFDNDGQYIQSTNYDGYYNYTVAEDGTITSKHDKRLGLNEGEDLRRLESTDIKFAKYPAGLNGQSIPPGWIPEDRLNLNLIDPSYQDHPATAGAFIDLQNGWVDMRNGIIGGWQLGQSSLMTPKQEIVLWAGDKTSTDDKKKFPYIQLGSVINGEMQGRLWIADYQVIGKTVNPGTDGIAVQSVSWSESGKIGTENYSAFEDAEGALNALKYYTTTLTDSTFKTKALNSWSLQDDTLTNASLQLGVSLETAMHEDDDNNGYDDENAIIIWKPTWKSSEASRVTSSLGTKTNPWGSIFADYGIFVKESFTTFEGVQINGKWHMVATQDWVSTVIVAALNKRIREVNNLASSALGKAKKAISDILSWAAAFNNRVFLVDEITIDRKGGEGSALKYWISTITADTDKKGYLTGTVSIATEKATSKFTAQDITTGNSFNCTQNGAGIYWSDLNGVAFALSECAEGIKNHYHPATIQTDSKGGISCTIQTVGSETAAGAYCSIFSSSGVDVSEKDGTVTVKVTVAGQAASDSFNMASTKFYKDAVEASYDNGYDAGYAKGKKDATCSKYHENSTKKVGNVTYKLQWVAQ